MKASTLRLEPPAALVGNVLILSVWAYAAILRDVSKDFYYRSAQEDEYLEWATFWAFIFAAVVCVLAGVYQRRARGELPWFLVGVGVFCFVVAMEEISWGQRILAYRPPAYFLEHNFQQELNFHNVVSTKLRKLTVKGVMLGYGVALPLLTLVPAVRNFLSQVAIVAPPLALAPSFFATWWFYHDYPWSLTGEWAEMMLGLGFLFAALTALLAFRGSEEPASSRKTSGQKAAGRKAGDKKTAFLSRQAVAFAAAWVLAVGVGLANAMVSRTMRRATPEVIETTRDELEALKRDFLGGKVKTKCNRHRRLYTFKERYEQDYLLEGAFAALVAQGLPDERAEFFLDPWNSPYWIRDRCDSDKDRRIVFIYSFGPNRRRDSSRWEILGDDVGTIVYDGEKVRDIIRRR